MSEEKINLAFLLEKEPVRKIEQQEILSKIMHRDPFLFVDHVEIIEEGKYFIGVKKYTGDEYFFKGHFPGMPIMPAVLSLESMSQCAGAVLINDIGNKVPMFLGVEDAKFRSVIKPGDTVKMPMQILRNGRISKLYGEAYVDGQLCVQSFLSYILADKKQQ